MRYILQITITKLIKNITGITIILLIVTIQQIIKAQNINITVPVITITQTPTNVPSPTTIVTTQTIIQSPSTNYINDANTINKLIAELITIAISTIVITIIICIKKRNTKILKQQINRLATSQTSRPRISINNM